MRDLKEYVAFLEKRKTSHDAGFFEAPLPMWISRGLDHTLHSSAQSSQPTTTSMLCCSLVQSSVVQPLEALTSHLSSSEDDSSHFVENSLGDDSFDRPTTSHTPAEDANSPQKPPRLPLHWSVVMARPGGMGMIYFCYDQHRQVPFVIKTFRQDLLAPGSSLLRKFMEECRLWLSLRSHPNVVRAYDLKLFSHRPYLFLEFFPGDPAHFKAGLYSPEELLPLALQIARAMEVIVSSHPHFVHRDIKPGNLLVAPGRVKITDMGLASTLAPSPNHRTQKKWEGGVTGTPPYMSPEQWTGHQVNERSDIYSFGATLFELIHGHPPFVGQTRYELYQKHVKQSPEFGLQAEPFPPPFLRLIERCLAKSPDQRPSSFGEIRRELEKIRHPRPIRRIGRQLGQKVQEWFHRWRVPQLTRQWSDKIQNTLDRWLQDLSQKSRWGRRELLHLVNLSGLRRTFVGHRAGHNFSAVDLSQLDLRDFPLYALYFPHGNLAQRTLDRRNMEEAVLYRANLKGADLTGVRLRRANLKETNLSGAQLQGARLQNSFLQKANLHRAILRGAHLEGANLTGADLSEADLTGVHLTGALISRDGGKFPLSPRRHLRREPITLDGEDSFLADLVTESPGTWQIMAHLHHCHREEQWVECQSLLDQLARQRDRGAIPLLGKLIRDSELTVARRALELLGRLAQLDDREERDPRSRQQMQDIARILATAGRRELASQVEEIRRLLGEKHLSRLAREVSQLGEVTDQHLEGFIQALHHPDSSVRRQAAQVLEGIDHPRAVQALHLFRQPS